LHLGFLMFVAAHLAPESSAMPAEPSAHAACLAALTAQALDANVDVPVKGRTPVAISVRLPPGAEILVEAVEHGNDVVLDAGDSVSLAHADNPVRRSGRQWAIIAPMPGGSITVRLTSKEHDAVSGDVSLRAYALSSTQLSERCNQAVRALAAADAAYARGQDVSRAQSKAGAASARHEYLIAVEEYLRAYGLLDDPADAALRVTAAHAIAATYYQDLKQWARSAEWAARTEAAARELHLDYDAARAGALIAASWIEMATQSAASERSTAAPMPARKRMDHARALLRSLERFHRQRRELYDATLQLNTIGLSYNVEGRYREAEPIIRRAIARFGALHEWPRQGVALSNLAFSQWGQGDLLAAAETFHLALGKLGPEPYPYPYLIALINSGLVAFAVGDFDVSLRVNAQALRLARKVQARLPESQSLYGLGVTYYALGDRALARQYLEESLALRPANVEARGRVSSLRALSAVYGDEGRLDAALAADEEALALASSSPSRARMLIRLAVDAAASGHVADALASIRAVLDGKQTADPGIRAEALIARGHIYRVTGKYSAAAADLRAAVAAIALHDDPDRDFRANLELAATWAALDKPAQALAAVNRALARSDELRRQTASPEFRAQRQAPLRPAYDLKLSLLAERYRQLIAAGQMRIAERLSIRALGTAEHERAQSLADVSSLTYSRLDSTVRAQLERRERLYRDLAARRFQLAAREDGAGGIDARAVALRAEIVAIRRELDALNVDLARISGVRSSAAAESPASWPRSLRERAPDTVIVDYWLGARDAYAWIITRDGIRWAMLGDSGPITASARAMHEAFRGFAGRPQRDRSESAAVLYDQIIRPLGELTTGNNPIVVVPDGALSYVPFAALRMNHADDARYLIQQHDIALAPAAWWLLDRPPPVPVVRPSRVLLVSDPIYGPADDRLGPGRQAGSPHASSQPAAEDADLRQFEALDRLPWTAREAELIKALVPAAQVDHLFGAAATRARVLASDWSKYRIVHLASHGMVDAAMPQLSALILGAYDEHGRRVDQALRAADIEGVTLQADIVSLSACDTAVGPEIVGEGAVGLAATTLARGAGAVLASLWQSPDEMSARLMTEFYRGVLAAHRSTSSALGSAMRSVLASYPRADPAFWATYQLSISHLDGQSVSRAVQPSDFN
jgi:CHAT domain-containing protein